MKITTYTDLRKNLARMMDETSANHEPLIVTRSGGEACVLMSLEDFNAFTETDYLLASPKNAAALRQSIAELDAGKTVTFSKPDKEDTP